CHPRREIALLRAVSEAAQSRLTLIAGSRDDITRMDYELSRDHAILGRLWTATQADGVRRLDEVPTYEHDTFDAHVALQLDCLRRDGFAEAVVVDLTRTEFGLPVVHALVPGLRMGPTRRPLVPGHGRR